MNGNIVIIVTNRRGKIVDSMVFQRSKYDSADNYERAIARKIGSFEQRYSASHYRIHQGSASDVSSFLTVYPELARP